MGAWWTGESVKASLMTEVPEPLIPLVVLAGKMCFKGNCDVTNKALLLSAAPRRPREDG